MLSVTDCGAIRSDGKPSSELNAACTFLGASATARTAAAANAACRNSRRVVIRPVCTVGGGDSEADGLGIELCGMASTPLTYRQRMTPCSSTTKRAVVSRTPKRLATSGRPFETIRMVACVPAPTAYIPASSSFTGSQCAEARITSTVDPRRSDNISAESTPGSMSAKLGAASPMPSTGEEVCISFAADTCTRNVHRRCKRRADCNVFCERPVDRLVRGAGLA